MTDLLTALRLSSDRRSERHTVAVAHVRSWLNPGYGVKNPRHFGVRKEALILGGQVQVANVAPKFQCATSDVSSADKGDAITANSVAYTLVEVHPSDTGVTTLILERNK